ncbi:MAG: hypothetical protein RMY34_24845 [Aulosira sp. DedQUE10]|nr:hypothetical protein [Aulosira sp. DedQUE10]
MKYTLLPRKNSVLLLGVEADWIFLDINCEGIGGLNPKLGRSLFGWLQQGVL